jgi:hypothetical protein
MKKLVLETTSPFPGMPDLREGRIVVCNPAPLPVAEMQRTCEQVKSWGMLEHAESTLALVNMDVRVHAAA